MRYFPISIDTRDKKALVLGGGRVAYKKIYSLFDSELEIFVIAQEFCKELEDLANKEPSRLHLKNLSIDKNFVYFGYDFIIIATNQTELNDALEKRAKSRGLMYLRCDKGHRSSFILNKIVKNNSLVASVSTGGHNPTITRIVGRDIETLLKGYDPKKIEILNEIRRALVAKKKENIPEIMESLWDKEAITLNQYLEEVDEDKDRI